jgi:hypothetical protein
MHKSVRCSILDAFLILTVHDKRSYYTRHAHCIYCSGRSVNRWRTLCWHECPSIPRIRSKSISRTEPKEKKNQPHACVDDMCQQHSDGPISGAACVQRSILPTIMDTTVNILTLHIVATMRRSATPCHVDLSQPLGGAEAAALSGNGLVTECLALTYSVALPSRLRPAQHA